MKYNRLFLYDFQERKDGNKLLLIIDMLQSEIATEQKQTTDR